MWQNMEILLKLGADANFADKKERTALHHALNSANSRADASFKPESLLLKYKANINAIDYRGRSPLHYMFAKMGEPFISSQIDPIEAVSSLTCYPGCQVDIQGKMKKERIKWKRQNGEHSITLCSSKEFLCVGDIPFDEDEEI